MAFDWTDEIISLLRTLWNDGRTTMEIARQIGISKNAVVGKAHRLGLTARPSPIIRTGIRKARPKANRPRNTLPAMPSHVQALPPMPVPAEPPAAPKPVIPGPRPVRSLEWLTERQSCRTCEWVVNDAPPYIHCDQPTAKIMRPSGVEVPSVYCAAHIKRAFQKPRARAA